MPMKKAAIMAPSAMAAPHSTFNGRLKRKKTKSLLFVFSHGPSDSFCLSFVVTELPSQPLDVLRDRWIHQEMKKKSHEYTEKMKIK
jgi:hypothetical protein